MIQDAEYFYYNDENEKVILSYYKDINIEEFNDWFCWYVKGYYYNDWFFNGSFEYYLNPRRGDKDKLEYLIYATNYKLYKEIEEISDDEIKELVLLYCLHLLSFYCNSLSFNNTSMLKTVVANHLKI